MFGLSGTITALLGAVSGAIVAGLIMFGVGNYTGYNKGYAAAQAENRQADFEQAKERRENDTKVDKLPDADLCRLLGGSLQPDGSCV